MHEGRGSFDALRRWSVVGLGGLILAVPLAYTAFVGGSEISQTLLLSVPVALGVTLVAFGTWIARSDYDTGAIQRITAWSLGGLLVIGTLGLWEGYLHVLQGTPALEAGHEVMIDGATGAGIGSIVGFYDVRQRSQRRVAERAQESLEEYREIFEKVDEGIAINDPVTGKVGEVNQRYAAMTGYDRAELRDMTIEDISADDPSFDQEAALERIEQVMAGQPQTFDWLLERKDGTTLWAEVSLKLATVGGSERILAVVRDITDRREREQQIAEQKRQLDTLIQNLPIILFALDDEGEIFLQEGNGLSALGLAPGDQVGESAYDAYADAPDVIDAVDRALDGESVNTVLDIGDVVLEAWYTPVFEDGEVDHVIGSAIDITDREQRKEQLAELHDSSRRLAYATTRKEVAEITVEIARDVLAKPVSTLWRYEANRECLVPVAMTDSSKVLLGVDDIAELEPITDGELGMEVFRSGEIWSTDDYGTIENAAFDIPLGNVILVPLDDHGLLEVGQRAVETATDEMLQRASILGLNASAALDRTTHEELLRERTEELEVRTSQMEFINSIIRHDVLNGMTVIRSRGAFLEERLDGSDGEYAETIVRWCDNIVGLVERVQTVLKTLSGDEAVSLAPIDAAGLVDEELTRLAQTYPDVTFERDLPESLPVRADELLADVIGNVVTNAIEHNDPAGLRVQVTATTEDGRTRIRIADNGSGIPPGEHESVFRRGESHAKTAGSGFGLFFVDAMITAYGGDVWVENDDGAVFVLELDTAEKAPKTDSGSTPRETNE